MKKTLIGFLAVLTIILLVPLFGCQKRIKVSYGSKVVCGDCGKVIESSIKKTKVPEAQASKRKVEIEKATCRACSKKRAKRAEWSKKRKEQQKEEQFVAWLESGKKKIGTYRRPIQLSGGMEQLNAEALGNASYVAASGGEKIRVGVYSTSSSISVSGDNNFGVYDSNNRHLHLFQAGDTVTIDYLGGLYKISGPGFTDAISESIKLYSSSSSILQVTDMLNYNRFRGVIEISYSPFSDRLWAINEVGLEDYLNGIGEEPENWEGIPSGQYFEFLKAAIVTFRTYVLAVKQEGKHNQNEPFDVCSFTPCQYYGGCCQWYIGYERETHGGNLKAAVNATQGQILTYAGEPIRAPYFTGCNGRTRSWQEVWGGEGKPWAVSVPDPYCAGKSLVGHGVGMCMRGAKEMARIGLSYDQILTNYYRGTQIETR